MSYLNYNENKIVERYRVWVTHILMVFVTMTLMSALVVLFFKILIYLSTSQF